MVKEYIRQINSNVQESYISLILGFLVVVVSGVLFYNFFSKRTSPEQPINQPVPTAAEEVSATISGTLTVVQPTRILSVTPTITIRPSATAAPTIPTTVTVRPSLAPTVGPSVKPTPIVQNPPQPDSVYSVQKGDTVWALSVRYYGTGFKWQTISQANKLVNPQIIEVGQKLTIPGADRTDTRILATSTQLPTSYTVTAGDSLWTISEKQYGTGFEWPNIAQENKLPNPHLIYPGSVLQLPRPQATLNPPGGGQQAPTGQTKK